MVPGPLMVAVVEAEVVLPKVTKPVLLLQEAK